VEVHTSPLQRQQLAQAEPGTQCAQHPRSPARETLVREGHEVRGLRACERLDFRRNLIPLPKTTYGPKKYSMGAEEWILRELLQDRRDGVFVDVGAADARAFSNTFYLESALGWSGVAIDAQTEYAEDYARYRPRTRFRSFFVSNRSETTLPFYVPAQRASASADPQWAEQKKLGAVTTRIVSTVTLDDLLASERITRFDLLSMDIEGHEPQALAGFSIDRFKPQVAVIEALADTRQAVLDYFTRHGYVLQTKYLQADAFNLYFVPLK
jgi:FkbM family methyltransferase